MLFNSIIKTFHRSLSLKLSCAVALVVLPIVGIMSIDAYVQGRRGAVRRELSDLQSLSKDLAGRIDLSLASGRDLAAHLANTRDAMDYLGHGGRAGQAQKACQDWLDLQLRQTSGISSILILSPTGECLASTNRDFIGHDYHFRPYFREAMAGRVTLSDWNVGLVFRLPHLDVSAPVRLHGKIAGILVTEFPVDAVEQAIRATGVHGRAALLINRSGVVLAHSNPAFQYHSLKPLDPPVLAEIMQTRQFMGRDLPVDPRLGPLAEGFERVRETSRQQTATFRESRSLTMAALTPLVEKDWVIAVAIPQDEILLPIRKAMVRTLLVGLSAMLLGALAAFAAGRLLLGPIFRLSDAMGRFGRGDGAARARVTDQDERGRLSQTFNTMADSLQVNQARLAQRTLELERSETQFRLLFEKAPMGMVIADPHSGRFLSVNPRMGEILGYAPAELLKSDFQSITHPDHLAEDLVSFKALAAGDIPEVVKEKRYLDRSGRTVWARLRMVRLPVIPGHPPRILALVEDITEHLQAGAALARERQALEAQVQSALVDLRLKDQMLASQNRLAAMGEMVSNIAHQWRQPLNALSLLLANLRDAFRFGDLDSAAVERTFALGDVLIQRMSSTISDFRSFLRPGKAKAAFSAVDQVRAAVRLMEGSLVAADIRVQIDADADVQLFGFESEYCHVLLNLLANAREAILDRRVHPGRITIRVWAEAGFGGLAMADNGGGIPDECLDRIFEPYFSTREMGTGIGLYLSKQIIESSMGGRIRAGNGPDGAEFTVLVPASGVALSTVTATGGHASIG
jgi:PAS domain S-box-containing protein